MVYNDLRGPDGSGSHLLRMSAIRLSKELEKATEDYETGPSGLTAKPSIMVATESHMKRMFECQKPLTFDEVCWAVTRCGERNALCHSGVLEWASRPEEVLTTIDRDTTELAELVINPVDRENWLSIINHARSSRFIHDTVSDTWKKRKDLREQAPPPQIETFEQFQDLIATTPKGSKGRVKVFNDISPRYMMGQIPTTPTKPCRLTIGNSPSDPTLKRKTSWSLPSEPIGRFANEENQIGSHRKGESLLGRAG